MRIEGERKRKWQNEKGKKKEEIHVSMDMTRSEVDYTKKFNKY